MCRPYGLSRWLGGGLYLTFGRDRVIDRIETIHAVSAQKERGIGSQALERYRNLPEMIGFVITANSEERPIAPDDAVRAFECLEFRAFNVHFDVGDSFVSKDVIEPNAGNFDTGRKSDAASADAVPGKMDDAIVCGYRGVVNDDATVGTVPESKEIRHDCRIGFESYHLAKTAIGKRKERPNCISGVGSAIDETFVGVKREQAGKVLLIRTGNSAAIKVRQ